jgi:hypothetical protein
LIIVSLLAESARPERQGLAQAWQSAFQAHFAFADEQQCRNSLINVKLRGKTDAVFHRSETARKIPSRGQMSARGKPLITKSATSLHKDPSQGHEEI